MSKIIFYLIFFFPISIFGQVSYIDTTNRGDQITITNFTSSYKGFCLIETHTDKSKKVSKISFVSGPMKTINADSTNYGYQKRKVGHVWISIQAEDYNEFFFSESTTKEGKPVKYTEGTTKRFRIELPYYQAKEFFKEVW